MAAKKLSKKNKSPKKPKHERNLMATATEQTLAGGRMLAQGIMLPPRVVAQIAEEVAKRVVQSVPVPRRSNKKKTSDKIESAFILDTSAIIDGRVFDLSKIGAFIGNFVLLSGVLDELKNIADSREDAKKERGRRALHNLDEFKKVKNVKLFHIEDQDSRKAVDERIISYAKKTKGRIITCDYNLSKKARITGAISIDLYEMANILKTTAVPGEEFFVKVVQKGKGAGQGVGYLPDGTMIVIEQGEHLINKTVKVVISRVIQTDAGRIFFGKILG